MRPAPALVDTYNKELEIAREPKLAVSEGSTPPTRHILVVVAPSSDPELEDVVRAARDSAIRVLEGNGHRVSVLDLTGFDAALSTDERRAYLTATPLIDPITQRHADLVRSSDGLIVVYASKMSTLPPVMKGWLDRTLVPGVSFVLNDAGHVQRGLTRLDDLVGIAVYGEDWRTTKRHRDAGRRIILRNVRSCGRVGLRTTWLPFYEAHSADEARVAEFVARIERRMGKL